jgi:hypothetical protein
MYSVKIVTVHKRHAIEAWVVVVRHTCTLRPIQFSGKSHRYSLAMGSGRTHDWSATMTKKRILVVLPGNRIPALHLVTRYDINLKKSFIALCAEVGNINL